MDDTDIEVSRPDRDELERQGVSDWPVWEKGVSRFEWHYDEAETCYLLEGQVAVTTPDGREVRFGAGDRVRFPAGLSCTWDITVPVRKHYRMG
jgi:uncharacterized cupin superfamily protein